MFNDDRWYLIPWIWQIVQIVTDRLAGMELADINLRRHYLKCRSNVFTLHVAVIVKFILFLLNQRQVKEYYRRLHMASFSSAHSCRLRRYFRHLTRNFDNIAKNGPENTTVFFSYKQVEHQALDK